jgi:hypothetical protein
MISTVELLATINIYISVFMDVASCSLVESFLRNVSRLPLHQTRKPKYPWTCQYSDQLWAIRYGEWTPVGWENFYTLPDQPWGPPSLLYRGYWVSFPGVKHPRRGVSHPPPSTVEVKERVELYLRSASGPSWSFLWTVRINKWPIPRYVDINYNTKYTLVTFPLTAECRSRKKKKWRLSIRQWLSTYILSPLPALQKRRLFSCICYV